MSSAPSSVSKRKSESMDSDEFERCTTISKMIKLEDNNNDSKPRRESVSSSKSPESLSVLSSYPSSPQSSFNYSESSINYNFLAGSSTKTISAFNSLSMNYPALDMNQFYSCRDFLNTYTSQLELNDYNSDVFQKYFWYAVQYYMLKQQMNLN